MYVWYAKGVFNMKFQINNDKMKIFSTNQNDTEYLLHSGKILSSGSILSKAL